MTYALTSRVHTLYAEQLKEKPRIVYLAIFLVY